MINQITDLNSFGLLLTFATYIVGKKIESKIKIPFINTMVIALAIIIPILLITNTSYESYMKGASIISSFIGPATVCLAIPIYKQIDIFNKFKVPLMIGLSVGIFLSVLFIGVLCNTFKLPAELMVPFYSKSITVAIAMEVTRVLGGNPSIAITYVLMTGISGSMIGVLALKLLKIKNPVAQGAALGSSSHSMGVSEAIGLGEMQGAIAGLSMGMAGILGVFIIPVCAKILSLLF